MTPADGEGVSAAGGARTDDAALALDPAQAARQAFAARVAAPGHVVENVRGAVAGLETAFASGALVRTPALEAMLSDLASALEGGEAGRVGAKSADAARRISRAIQRELERAATSAS